MFPILYQNNDFVLYAYPLLMGLGWGVAYQVFFDLLPITFSRLHGQLLFWGIFLSAWLGAKILFLITLPTNISQNLYAQTYFWTGGGFVFYGGLLAGVGFLLLARGLRLPVNKDVWWAIVPALTFGHAIGRLGCFLAGCCYGREATGWWTIYLHQAWRHPTQLIEAGLLFILGCYLLRSKSERRILMAHYLLIYGTIRLGVEFLRGDGIRGQWGELTPSSWISLVVCISGILLKYNIFRPLGVAICKFIK